MFDDPKYSKLRFGWSMDALKSWILPGSTSKTATGDLLDSYTHTSATDEYRKAIKATTLGILAAIAFGFGTYIFRGRDDALAFLTGYAVELSLSVDNLFVFLMLFKYFQVHAMHQNRVLSYGIYGAVIFRGIMIFLGVAMIERFVGVTLLFAIILLVSAYKVFQDGDGEEDLENNMVLKWSHYLIRSTSEFDGDRFFIRENKVAYATPLFMCLVCVEVSDLVFAIDSIPAVIGVSHDPFIVYSSNIFAIMGLRSLFTLVSKAVSDMPYLKSAVALVLGFIGLKMVLEFAGIQISTMVSLGVIFSILGGGFGMSIMRAKMFKKGVDLASGEKESSHRE